MGHKPTPKNKFELDQMRKAGRLAAEALDMLTDYVEEGIPTSKLDKLCIEFIKDNNATSATIGYGGDPTVGRIPFPSSICTSLNNVVCHGIPSDKDILKNGDIMNIDVTVIVEGFHGDTSRMYFVGDVSDDARKLVDVTYDAMMAGINTIKSGSYLSDIGKAIQATADNAPDTYAVVKDYCGHGIGRVFHDAPMVLHYHPQPGVTDFRLRKGTTFTVEPMINIGTDFGCETMADQWTVLTTSRKLSAQFEHTIAVTEDGVELLTESPKGLHKPPYK